MRIRRITAISTAAALAALCAAPFCTAESAGDCHEALSDAFRKAAETVAPCVVQIKVERTADIDTPPPGRTTQPVRPPAVRALPREIIEKFQENRMYHARPAGGTSGVIVTEEGHILTSWYNVSGTVKSITVALHDGSEHKAAILGRDEDKDLCMIKIEAQGLPAARVGFEAVAKPGRFLVVVGRGRDSKSYTMTTGIVSAQQRYRGQAFQLSARVNYENAGGAVVGLDGRLLGIVSHISHVEQLNRAGLNTGVGLAAPSPGIAEILDRLRAGESIPRFRGPFLGIRFEQGWKEKGVKIEYVYKDLPSRKAGLMPGDIIIYFNNVLIEGQNDLLFAIWQCDPDQKVGFTVQRTVDGKEQTVDLWAVLALRPPEEELKKLDVEYNEWKKSQAGGGTEEKEPKD